MLSHESIATHLQKTKKQCNCHICQRLHIQHPSKPVACIVQSLRICSLFNSIRLPELNDSSIKTNYSLHLFKKLILFFHLRIPNFITKYSYTEVPSFHTGWNGTFCAVKLKKGLQLLSVLPWSHHNHWKSCIMVKTYLCFSFFHKFLHKFVTVLLYYSCIIESSLHNLRLWLTWELTHSWSYCISSCLMLVFLFPRK